MEKVLIVGMKPEYIRQAAALHGEAFKGVGETPQKFLSFIKMKRVAFCAIDTPGKVIGYIAGVISLSGIYLNWITVKKSARNKGVGLRLMKALEAEGKKSGAAFATLDTRNRFKEAIKLYLDCGYNIFGCQLGSDGELQIRMNKKIK
jgi:ribosomal protein S18 acetylase RimI-like enzyme